MKTETCIRNYYQKAKGYPMVDREQSILLNANEFPYNIPCQIMQEISKQILKIEFNRYPFAYYENDLKSVIAQKLNISNDNIIIGVGSNNLLDLMCRVIGEVNDNILITNPSFFMYKEYILGNNKNVITIDLDSNFQINLENLKNLIIQHQPKLIIIANPNNPTGNIFKEEIFEYLFNEFRGIICIDEVYYKYSKKNYLNIVHKKENVIILRSISKIGMAGSRIGFAIASKKLIEYINKAKHPYSVTPLSSIAAKVFFEFSDTMEPYIEKVIKQREILIKELSMLDQVKVYDSQSNFVLCNFKKLAKELFEYLLTNSIVVKNFFGNPILDTYLRITVGTEKENEILLDRIKSFYTNK